MWRITFTAQVLKHTSDPLIGPQVRPDTQLQEAGPVNGWYSDESGVFFILLSKRPNVFRAAP